MSPFEVSLITAGVALVAGLWLLQRVLVKAIVRRPDPRPLERYPSVSVIRPIRGVDTELEENVLAALDNGYPGDVETLFVFDDESDPAVPHLLEGIEAHEEAHGTVNARVLFCGPPPTRRTGKLNAMIYALEEAKGDVIVFADSDIRPDKSALTTLVATLMRSKEVGSAFAPVTVSSDPLTIGDAGYALLLNGLYGPAADYAARQNGDRLPFIMGQFMALRRDAIEAIGGLESAEGQLVDDMYLGALISQAGYTNAVSPHRVPIIQRGASWREFFGTYLRWLTFGRTGLPDWRFKLIPALQGMGFWGGAALTIAGLATLHLPSFAMGLLATFFAAHTMVVLHYHLGGARPSLRLYGAGFAVLGLAPFVFGSVYLKQDVNWRGRKYSLDRSSRLAGEH